MTTAKTPRAALYLRVSTDRQTSDNQRAALEAVAAARGWSVVSVYDDAGVSGAKGRNQRPGLDKLLKDATRRRFDVVMVWAIDRLGRSLVDLLGTIQHLDAAGVDLFVEQQAIDTTTPAGKLVFHIVGAIAEFERSMIRARIHAGLARARAQGKRPGRPYPSDDKIDICRRLLADGVAIVPAAKASGIGVSIAQTIKREMRAAAVALPTAP